jgi:phenylalanyl-tRNA synthetase alpha chain
MPLATQIAEIRSQFLNELKIAGHSKDVEHLKVRYLGKKGPVQNLMQELKNCSQEERPLLGKLINDLK